MDSIALSEIIVRYKEANIDINCVEGDHILLEFQLPFLRRKTIYDIMLNLIVRNRIIHL